MKKLFAAFAVGTAFLLAACGQSTDAKKAEEGQSSDKTYRVAMNAAFAPFQWIDSDGKIIGFEIDLMDEMAKEGNFKVQYINTPWDGIFATLASGDNDVLSSAITITEDRKKTMDFTDPYFEIKQVILVPAGKNVSTPEDLKKLNKIAVTTGTSADFVAQKILGKTSPKIARFESLPLVLKEVEGGGADAAISDSAVVAHYIKNNPNKGFTVIETEGFDQEYYGMAVQKGDTATLNMLNAALKKVKENGKYEEIYNKYFAK